jgi:hypothetical protein
MIMNTFFAYFIVQLYEREETETFNSSSTSMIN